MIYTKRASGRGEGDGAVGRRSQTRAALLSTGRAVFARRGFDGASVREITSEAGANLGAITYHFGSKRGLYEAVLEEGLSPIVSRVGEIANGAGTGMDRLAAVIEVFFDYLGAHPELPRLMLQEVSAGKTPPPAVMAILRRNVGHVTNILTDGWRDGSIRRGNPMLSALSVVSQPIYMTLMAPVLLELGGIDLRDSQTRAEAVQHVRDVMRRGLGSLGEEAA
jgi:TetR/AcrR family transcriptional regulator